MHKYAVFRTLTDLMFLYPPRHRCYLSFSWQLSLSFQLSQTEEVSLQGQKGGWEELKLVNPNPNVDESFLSLTYLTCTIITMVAYLWSISL